MMATDRERVRSILKRSVMFENLTDAQLDALSGIAERRIVEVNDLLYGESNQAQGVFVVGSGQIKMFQLSPEGKEYIIRIAGAGLTFAEAATFGQRACPASARAMERSELAFLPRERLLPLLAADASLCLQVLKGLSVWVCQLVRTLENIVLRDSLGRLSGYLLSLVPDGAKAPVTVELPIKKRDLAAHLAITPEALSRTFARLVELEAIEHPDGAKISILSTQVLEGLAAA